MQVSLRFGMLNIVNYPEVISRYVNASDVYAVPFTVVFWQEREFYYTDLHSAEDDDENEAYNPWKESEDAKNVCNLVVLKDTCAIGDNNTVIDVTDFQQNDIVFGPPLPPPSWQTKVKPKAKMKQRTFQFEYVNDKTWSSLIEQSVGPVKSYTALPRKQTSRLFSVALVVFLLDGCSYCTQVLPTIEQISLDAKCFCVRTQLFIRSPHL
ncbi:hypothetical protein OS493_039370 [Desmophyllum pertusum]|uniref:Uncharacterized protein n=1 Tax=Desmophyllum pertusum TaxID=174260 RepID=A0A9W9ZH97_9CNID|nr:hypothetical protein OS493_039370 [Desmophyllum pertusum]